MGTDGDSSMDGCKTGLPESDEASVEGRPSTRFKKAIKRLPMSSVALVVRIVLVPSSRMSFATSATVSRSRSNAKLT